MRVKPNETRDGPVSFCGLIQAIGWRGRPVGVMDVAHSAFAFFQPASRWLFLDSCRK
jgi:hypothetical protein